MGDALEVLGIEHFTVWNSHESGFVAHCRHKATRQLVVCPKTGDNCRAADGIEINAIAKSIKLACKYLSYEPAEADPMVSMQSTIEDLQKTVNELLKANAQLTGAGSPPVTEENTEAVPDGMDEKMPGDEDQPHEADDPDLTEQDQKILEIQDKVITDPVDPHLLDETPDEEDIYKDVPPPPPPPDADVPEKLARAKKLRASNLDD